MVEPKVGSKHLVRYEAVEVMCEIKEVERSYGKVRMRVQPVGGKGSQWVEAKRIGGPPTWYFRNRETSRDYQPDTAQKAVQKMDKGGK